MSGPCPTCGGRGGVSEAWGLPTSGLVPCPDCAGTGKAQNSITANERLRNAAPRLAAALKDMIREAEWLLMMLNKDRDRTGQTHEVETERIERACAALREAGVDDA